MTEKFNVKSEILMAISKTDDPVQRAHLMLVLGVLEYIEELVNDDLAMRTKVLNGHANNHHDDHDWIGEQRKRGCDQLCIRVKEHLDEAYAEKVKAKTRVSKVTDLVIDRSVWLLIGALAYYLGFGWLIK